MGGRGGIGVHSDGSVCKEGRKCEDGLVKVSMNQRGRCATKKRHCIFDERAMIRLKTLIRC